MAQLVYLFLTLLLALHILVSLSLTLNIFYMLHDMKNAEILLYTEKKKERKVSLSDCKFK